MNQLSTRIRRMGITAQIFSIVLLVLIVTILSLSIVVFREQTQVINDIMAVTTETGLRDRVEAAGQAEKEAENLRDSLDQNFLRLARSIAMTVEADPSLIETERMQSLASEIGVNEIHIINEEGILFAGSEPGFFGFDFAEDPQTRPFLRILEDSSLEIAQDPQQRGVDDSLFQYIGVARRDAPGIIQIGVAPAELERLLAATTLERIIADARVGEQGYMYAVDPENGRIIYHNQSQQTGTDLRQYPWARELLQQSEGTMRYSFEGEELFAAFTPLEDIILVAVVPIAEYQDTLQVLLFALIVASLVIFIIAGIVTRFAVKRSLRPITVSAGYAKAIAAGDLTQQIDEAGRDRTDEIGILMRSFHDMQERLSEVVRSIKESSDYVTSGSRDMSDVSQQISEGSTRLSDTAQQLSQGTAQQSASVEEVSASMEEMAANIQQSADNAMATEKIALQSAEEAEQGGQAVAQTVAAMRQITEKISIIEDIARETNMLSLNAAIEAARAGEHGKGFAVVAAQVRKLAENSSKAAGEISTLSANSVGVAEEAGRLLDGIVPRIRKTAELVQEISASSREMNSGAQEVNSAITQLDQVVQQSASAAEDVAGTSEQQSSQTDQLAATAEELEAQARQLEELVEYFQLAHETAGLLSE